MLNTSKFNALTIFGGVSQRFRKEASTGIRLVSETSGRRSEA